MHAPGHIHFTHRGVYKRYARAALFPSQYRRIQFIFIPRKPIPTRFPILIQNMRRMMHQMIGKLTPNNLFQKRLSASFAILQFPQAGMPALVGDGFSWNASDEFNVSACVDVCVIMHEHILNIHLSMQRMYIHANAIKHM